MNHEAIQQLLDRYFEGETTLQEEAQLRDYFRRDDVPDTLRPYRPLFRFFEAERQHKPDDAFEDRLLQQLEQRPRLRVHRLRVWVASAAAAFVIALAAWWMYPQLIAPEPQPVAQAIDWSKYEPETPEEAYRVLKTSLKTTSKKLNQGAATAVQKVGKAREAIEIVQ
jgi:hypothetical protein